MIYGDHYGISENHNNAMEKLLGEQITPAKFTDLNRTGFWSKIAGKDWYVLSPFNEYADPCGKPYKLLSIVNSESEVLPCPVWWKKFG